MRPAENFIGQPVRSLQTMLRVISRNDGRLPIIIPDGIYGATTMQAVSAFQRQEGLPVTGVADQETWDRIYERYDLAVVQTDQAEPIEILLEPGQIIRAGESSPYIYLVQSILAQLSQDHPSIARPPHTGVMDEETVTSLIAFQELTDLEPTGELDRLTWKYLSRHFTLNAHHNFNYPNK